MLIGVNGGCIVITPALYILTHFEGVKTYKDLCCHLELEANLSPSTDRRACALY